MTFFSDANYHVHQIELQCLETVYFFFGLSLVVKLKKQKKQVSAEKNWGPTVKIERARKHELIAKISMCAIW